MSSLAQEESRSISENVIWGHRKRFAEGKVMVPFASLLGYVQGDNGEMVVDEQQAAIVRRIYAMYLAGNSAVLIAKILTDEGVPTPLGKSTWSSSTIGSILRNEKYKGDALLQKTFTVDFLTKTTKKNEGEVTQYYIQDHHEAIVDPAIWEAVQHEITRRRGRGRSSRHPFASRIQCGQCGGWFGPKTWHSGTVHRKRIWRCNNKYSSGAEPCPTRHVTEEDIKHAFEQAVARLAPPPSQEVLDIVLDQTCPLDDLSRKLDQANQRLAQVVEELEREAARGHHCDSSKEHVSYLEELEAGYRNAQASVQKINQDIRDAIARKARIQLFYEHRRQHPEATYSPAAWIALVHHVTVHTDGRIEVVLKMDDGKLLTE